MTDAPSDPSEPEETSGYVPSGLRRSTFSAPAEGTPPPVWDDDALAAAMEEEVRPYTSPITLAVPRRPAAAVPAAPEPAMTSETPPEPTPDAAPGPMSQAASAQEPPSTSGPAAAPRSGPAHPAAPAPDHIAVDPFTALPPVDDEQLARDLEGSPTLDAMQRLEEELRRRAAAGVADDVTPRPSFFEGEPPVSPEPPGPDPDVLRAAPPPRYTPPPLVEPPVPVDPSVPVEVDETVTRLLPPPTDLPDIAHRAELPPPPGYTEDGSAVDPEAGAAPPQQQPELQRGADPEPTAAAAPEPAPVTAPPTPETAEPEPLGWDHLLATVSGPTAPVPLPPAPVTPMLASPSEPGESAEPDPPAISAAAADLDDDADVIDPGDRIIAAAMPAPVEVPAAATDPVAVEEAVAEPAPVAVAAPPVLDDGAAAEPHAPRAAAVEAAGLEPTRREQRAGRAARLFWLWFAANASVVSVALGAVMLGMGMSLRQAIVATVIGIALSFIPLGFTTLAGKWSGQPTLIVSRATFGTGGNVLPAVLAVLVRVFWGGVLLWLLGDAVGRALVRANADAGLGATRWALIAAAGGLVLTAIVAAVGYGLLARVQLVLSILTGLMIVGAAAVTLPKVHLDVALTRQDGPWVLVVGGAVLVFAFVGLVWAFSGSDVARYQRFGGSGASTMLWATFGATFGATIPPFLLVVWGALLAASNPGLAAGLASHPLSTIAGVLPTWAGVPLLIAAGVGLLSGSVLTLYSGGFALQSLTPQVPRVVGVVVAALLALAAAAGLVLLGADTRAVVGDLAVVLAVPVAAWAGIFAAEMMIRNRRFHTPSLLAAGGIYPRARWVNLVGLVVIAVVGYAFVEGSASWLGWEGFGWRLLGVGASQPIASVDLGVLVALVLGIVLPLVTSVPAIRRQEAVDLGGAVART